MKNYIKILLIILLAILLIFVFYNFIFLKFWNKYNLEKSSIELTQNSQNSPFSISKIVMHSSAYGENKNSSFEQSSWILDIFQYSDIAIYIQPAEGELTLSNSVKKLLVEDIRISSPKTGNPCLYYLNSSNFGTPKIDTNYNIENSLEFTVLNDENENSAIQYNTPVFFADCSNPITLKYVNHSVKENFALAANQPFSFSGNLLKLANVSLKDLEATVNLTIKIVNNENKNYYYDLSLPIGFENGKNSIFDGNILVQNEYENYKFMEK